MKRTILVWLLGLAVAFGLAQGQDGSGEPPAPDTSGAAQEQQAPPDTDMTEPETPGSEGQPGQPAQPATEDQVGQPESDPSEGLLATLRANPEFSTFADAVEQAGLSDALQSGRFTILAPTNQAFEQSGISLDQLSQDELTALVRNHIISGVVSADQLPSLAGVVTLLGTEYAVTPMSDQQLAGEPADGEVAGGGQAQPVQPAEPVEPARPDSEDGGDGADSDAGEPTETDAEAGAETDVQTDVDTETDMGADIDSQPIGSRVSIGGANVVHEGVETEFGVIYGIDALLLPENFGEGVQGGGAAEPADTAGADADAEETETSEPGVDDETEADDETTSPR